MRPAVIVIPYLLMVSPEAMNLPGKYRAKKILQQGAYTTDEPAAVACAAARRTASRARTKRSLGAGYRQIVNQTPESQRRWICRAIITSRRSTQWQKRLLTSKSERGESLQTVV